MDDDDDKSLGLVAGIPDFIIKLYKMLMDTTGEVVCWSNTGTSFVIFDISEFTKNLLPSHFKHGNFASFVRQLNKYDFHKVKADDSKMYGSQAWEFSHSHFIRGQPQLLSQIKRKASVKVEKKVSHSADSLNSPLKNVSDVLELKSQVKYLENVQNEMSSHLKSLTLQYQQMLEQMSDFRHTISTQEQVIRSLIEYIPNDKKNILNQSLLNSMNSRVFPQVSPSQVPNTSSLDPTLNSRLNQFDYVQEPRNRLNISFKSVPDSIFLASKSFDMNSLSQTPVVSDLAPTIASTPLNLSNPAEPLSSGAPKWSAPPKVLLVEDDDTCRRLSSKLLQVFGCNFDIAVDGLDAVNRMNIGYKYDLVLMDIMMPNLDGVSATTRIRQFDQLTPIISMTSNITENDCMTYLANGMNDILVKPFNKSALLGMIKRHCADRTPTSSSFPGKVTDISGDKGESLNQIDSQLLAFMKMDSHVPSFISSDESFIASKKRARMSSDVESEDRNDSS